MEKLRALAIAMKKQSYCAYSHFAVGAALECEDGSVFGGCNVENASYGLTICAERTAAVKAVSEGKRTFCRIVISGSGDDFCYPCGTCRQFLYEFNPDMEVISLNGAGESKSALLRDLLPCGFSPDSMKREE